MPALYDILKFLHIVGAAVWLGIELTNSGDLRRALAKGRAEAAFAVARMLRVFRIALGGAALTVLTGVGLIVERGGFGGVTVGIHASLLLVVIMFAVLFVGALPALRAIAAVVDSDQDLAACDGPRKRYAATLGVNHLLWTVVLVLMIFL